ncbi:MAG TPA: hypothetical protein VIM06_02490 [Rhodanobacter sp.]
MSNVIDFLEKIGGNAKLRHASQGEVELALASEQIGPELSAAILAKDGQQIEKLLGQTPYCCLLFPEKEDEDDKEDSPSRDGEEIAARAAFHAMASLG